MLEKTSFRSKETRNARKEKKTRGRGKQREDKKEQVTRQLAQAKDKAKDRGKNKCGQKDRRKKAESKESKGINYTKANKKEPPQPIQTKKGAQPTVQSKRNTSKRTYSNK